MDNYFHCGYDGPIISVKGGKLRGFAEKGVYKFRGIQYAEAERYMPPKEVLPWEGVKDCLAYGRIAPTIFPTQYETVDIMTGFRWWPEGEDCLSLNVWTQNINDDMRRPVMVWLHGGGFFCGSSVECQAYEAENLCKDMDVVVVSLNHRLNIRGYLDLSDWGEEYYNSGNLGMQDIIAALRWVKENIHMFGGDANNITLFGQSGGGMKCTTLMQTPAADGLYNRVIIQSGVSTSEAFRANHESSTKIAAAVIKELGGIDRLRTVPFRDIKDAYLKVFPALKAAGLQMEWSPVQNDWYLGDPLVSEVTETFKKTPIIIGTCIAETLMWNKKYYDANMPEAKKLTLIRARYGDNTDRMLEYFTAAYPGKDLIDLLYIESMFRNCVLDYLDLRSSISDVPIYSYMISYDYSFNGVTPSYHASEHGLVFRSYAGLPIMQEPDIEKLSDEISGAWAAFAHSGTPDHPYLPEKWKPYKKGDENTFVFDKKSALKKRYDTDMIRFMASNCADTINLDLMKRDT